MDTILMFSMVLYQQLPATVSKFLISGLPRASGRLPKATHQTPWPFPESVATSGWHQKDFYITYICIYIYNIYIYIICIYVYHEIIMKWSCQTKDEQSVKMGHGCGQHWEVCFYPPYIVGKRRQPIAILWYAVSKEKLRDANDANIWHLSTIYQYNIYQYQYLRISIFQYWEMTSISTYLTYLRCEAEHRPEPGRFPGRFPEAQGGLGRLEPWGLFMSVNMSVNMSLCVIMSYHLYITYISFIDH